MDNNLNISLIIDKLDKKIADLNILISKNNNNEDDIVKLNELLKEKELILSGNEEEFKKIINKYRSQK